jgi:3-hydroxyacyl-[acyl-carrier-protein] dehydratase
MKGIEVIKKYLPHRYPFLLVDRILEVVPGKSIKAIKNVSANEPYFNGHFPSMAVMPGVLMIEAMAQASGILTYETLKSVPKGELYFLAGVDNVRFKRLVVPGDQLHLHVELTKHRLDVWKFLGTASVEGEVACTAEFMNVKEHKSDR